MPDSIFEPGSQYEGHTLPSNVTIEIEDGNRNVVTRFTDENGQKYAIYASHPDVLTHHYQQEEHLDIPLYTGLFRLPSEVDTNFFVGQVSLRWNPQPRIQALGTREQSPAAQAVTARALSAADGSHWIYQSEIELADEQSLPAQPQLEPETQVPGRRTTTPSEESLSERLRPALIGDTAPVDEVRFLLTNGWRALDASYVCRREQPWRKWRGRIRFTSSHYSVEIDTLGRITSQQDDLKKIGGYVVTHVGRVRRADGSRLHLSARLPLLTALRLGSSLAIGRGTDCTLPVGYRDGAAVSALWSAPRSERYRGVPTMLDEARAAKQIEELLPKVLDFCEDEAQANVLNYAVAYFTTANRADGIELSCAQAVSGLQLLSFYRLVTCEGMSRKEWKDSKAYLQIRRLLFQSGVSLSVPPHFDDLEAARTSMPTPPRDALQTVIKLRNVITHPSRDTPDLYTSAAWSEASSCAREFLLLSILHLLNYNGKYKSYTDPARHTGRTLPVPWAATSE